MCLLGPSQAPGACSSLAVARYLLAISPSRGCCFPVHNACDKHHKAFWPGMPSERSSVQSESCSHCVLGLWSLDDLQDPETKKVLEEVQAQPDRFVLKPQREGGGNNLYGQAILERLKDTKGLAAFILMQRIRPPINRFAPHPWPSQIWFVTD